MSWPWHVAERYHEIQNATSREKIELLGKYLHLSPEKRVLDIACGKGGPARVLAAHFGCPIVGVEKNPEFVAEGRAQTAAAGLEHLIEMHVGDGREFPLEREAWDAALCIGASFVWGHIADAAQALAPAVVPAGYVAIGEPFWRKWPLPEAIDSQEFVGFQETVKRFEASGLMLVGIIAASQDDWDRYESLHWLAIEDWLRENPDAPHLDEIRAKHDQRRRDYLSVERELLGWAIFVGQKP